MQHSHVNALSSVTCVAKGASLTLRLNSTGHVWPHPGKFLKSKIIILSAFFFFSVTVDKSKNKTQFSQSLASLRDPFKFLILRGNSPDTHMQESTRAALIQQYWFSQYLTRYIACRFVFISLAGGKQEPALLLCQVTVWMQMSPPSQTQFPPDKTLKNVIWNVMGTWNWKSVCRFPP